MSQKNYYKEAILFVVSLTLFSIIWDIVVFYIAPIFSHPQIIMFPTTLVLKPSYLYYELALLILYLGIFALFILVLSRLIGWFYRGSPKKELGLVDWFVFGFVLSLNQFSDLFGNFLVGVIIAFLLTLYFVLFRKVMKA